MIKCFFSGFSGEMDQVPRRLSSSLTLGSTDDTRFCHLCPNVRASANCVDCQIYLCPRCESQHKKYPAFKDHLLLKGVKMPSLYAKGHGTRIDALDKGSDFVSNTDPAGTLSINKLLSYWFEVALITVWK